MVYGYLMAIKALYGVDAYENAAYYLYEVPSSIQHLGKCIVKDDDGNEYDASKLSEYVKWIMSL
jgi:hypothetical protein